LGLYIVMGRFKSALVSVCLQSGSPVGLVVPARKMALREIKSGAGRPGARTTDALMAATVLLMVVK
jgi:hypothetical protein